MKRKITVLFVALSLAWGAAAQVAAADMAEGQSCTSIMVGKKASADGSVITSHTCDGRYRTWMRMEPAADHPQGAMHKVYRGTMHTAFGGDTTGLRLVGEIPEVMHTYAYLNTAYPCLNEKQLAIGESTFGGPDTLVNPNAMFTIEELERIVLQRCDNARGAIRLMGELVREYGYADGGECLTIADRNEVWQFEIVGCGKDRIGAVWVAQRVPDDEVAVACNIPRIGKIQQDNPSVFLHSGNAQAVARRYGLWDGTGEFLFWKAFNTPWAGGKNFREREYHIFNTLAPSLGLAYDMPSLPFSVRPDHKVSAQEVMALLRSTYEGTDMDMTQNLKAVTTRDGKADTVASPVANPWMGGNMQALLNYLRPDAVTFRRTVSVAWCSYSFVAQLRDWLPDEVGGVCWMSVDNPAQSPRIPIFCGTTRLPQAFSLCGHHGYSEDAVLWQYRKANKLATVAWGSTKKMMMGEVMRHEQAAFKGLAALESDLAARHAAAETPKQLREWRQRAQGELNDYTFRVYDETAYAWRTLERKLWERFGFGF